MTIRKIASIGHPVLRAPSRDVSREELASAETQKLIDDLIETMRDANGAGLAAPQVYEPVRICVLEVGDNPRYPYKPKIPLTVLVNPTLTALSDETFDNYEGCLSVPNLRGVVPRSCEVRVSAWDRHGTPLDYVARGVTAGTYQHEVDHLLGLVFLDRVKDTRTLTTWADFDRFHRDAFVARIKTVVERFGSLEGAMTIDDQATKAYYDEFAASYEAQRRPNDPHGYHALLDDLEVEVTERFGRGKDVLEVGCGTGLLLERFAKFARRAEGIDLSPGMLEKARARGLEVKEGSATDIPYPDGSFDVVCSFKVLAHVPDIGKALSEMARVTRPGGIVLAELYNPRSLRALAKRLFPPGSISERTKESAVYTRFDAPSVVPKLLPPGTRLIGSRGIRIVTPAAAVMRVPFLREVLVRLEHALTDSPLKAFGGFWVAIIQKD